MWLVAGACAPPPRLPPARGALVPAGAAAAGAIVAGAAGAAFWAKLESEASNIAERNRPRGGVFMGEVGNGFYIFMSNQNMWRASRCFPKWLGRVFKLKRPRGNARSVWTAPA